MTSAPVRDPPADHLITPQNSALLHRAGLDRVIQAGGQPISWEGGLRYCR